ncbi:hypothetical protein [Marmoricola sp. RAF53]|uniref:hypothetical protein n=1 Tax=Marmoricola sp. RAF53 TaxID=3233059 RepID=UPI003F9E00F2
MSAIITQQLGAARLIVRVLEAARRCEEAEAVLDVPRWEAAAGDLLGLLHVVAHGYEPGGVRERAARRLELDRFERALHAGRLGPRFGVLTDADR